jgi:hypothetical protein
MLTGWFGIQLCMYMSNTGNRRYAEPGSLPFPLSQHNSDCAKPFVKAGA